MSEYISREEVMDALLHEQYGYLCEDVIKSIHTADVREVKRGNWISDKKRLWYTCSVCGASDMLECHNNFCPNCGADMREDNETLSS